MKKTFVAAMATLTLFSCTEKTTTAPPDTKEQTIDEKMVNTNWLFQNNDSLSTFQIKGFHSEPHWDYNDKLHEVKKQWSQINMRMHEYYMGGDVIFFDIDSIYINAISVELNFAFRGKYIIDGKKMILDGYEVGRRDAYINGMEHRIFDIKEKKAKYTLIKQD
ncbi:MAG: hypothetical protein EKK55_08510 [Rhodocyclaceae bacterium]|nr:MAG: hypothetical protein EKK55_08510 [Rhodocyclaceae bacterium]